MKRILFTGKATALVSMLKRFSAHNKGLTVSDFLDNLARERRAKVAIAGNTKEQTSRAATL